MRRRQQIEATEWAKEFKASCPAAYEDALTIASLDVLHVEIYKSDENGAMEWRIAYSGPEFRQWTDLFWLDSKKTKKAAVELCESMEWFYQ
jgi:hypothetical protein